MHQLIVDGLEAYLTAPESAAGRQFEAHLETCEECRGEVLGMREVSGLFESLRSPDLCEAPPGFYARLTQRLETMRASSFWSLFSLNPIFGRRVVFASLLTLAVLGSYLVSREIGYGSWPSPESVLAVEQQNQDLAVERIDRDMMLVTLATYEP